jgi:hypothetical protein
MGDEIGADNGRYGVEEKWWGNEGRRPLGRHTYGWDNTEMSLAEMGLQGVARLIWLRTGKSWRTLMNTGDEPSGSLKCMELLRGCGTAGTSSRYLLLWSTTASIASKKCHQ